MSAVLVPRFLSAELARAIHDRQLAEHGGLAGVKDDGLLESAMASLFLRLNGVTLAYDKADAIRMVLALAAGELPEDEVAAWFRAHVVAQ